MHKKKLKDHELFFVNLGVDFHQSDVKSLLHSYQGETRWIYLEKRPFYHDEESVHPAYDDLMRFIDKRDIVLLIPVMNKYLWKKGFVVFPRNTDEKLNCVILNWMMGMMYWRILDFRMRCIFCTLGRIPINEMNRSKNSGSVRLDPMLRPLCFHNADSF